MILTTITHDVRKNLNIEEQVTVNAGQLHNIDLSELYADDTLIMASAARAAETVLQHIEQESGKYSMKVNYGKCIHLRMNDIERITYLNGDHTPMEQSAIFLGEKISADGSYKKEITNRLTSTWLTVRKLDLLWKKAPVSLKWKLRVFDAVIVSKLFYGLESIRFTEQDCAKLGAFQYRGLRKILNIRHPCWSRV